MRMMIWVIAALAASAPSLAAQDVVKKLPSDQSAPLDLKADIVYHVVIESDDYYPQADLQNFVGESKQHVDMARMPKSKFKHRRELFLVPSKAGTAKLTTSEGKGDAKKEYQVTLSSLDFGKKPFVEAKNSVKKEGEGHDYPVQIVEGKRYFWRLSTPAKAQVQVVVIDPKLPESERFLFGEANFNRESGWYAFQTRQTANVIIRVESIGNIATDYNLTVFEK